MNNNNKPSSFCTVGTKQGAFQLYGFLLSLSLFHKGEKVYVMCDEGTEDEIEMYSLTPMLDIVWLVRDVNKITNSAAIMEALKHEPDVLFLAPSIVVCDVIDYIDKTKMVGVAPTFVPKDKVGIHGSYSKEVLWTSTVDILRELCIKKMEDVVDKYSHFRFGENCNLNFLRQMYSQNGKKYISKSLIGVPLDKAYFKKKPLKFFNTQFNNDKCKEFNINVITAIQTARMYKLLAIIYRIIHRAWVITIPKQPLDGMWSHKDDSFRELADLVAENVYDVKLHKSPIFKNCWLEPTICLYDRPTFDWFTEDVKRSTYVLLGNPDIADYEKHNNQLIDVNVRPWIFWARHPKVLEKYMDVNERKGWSERPVESVFIGNYENNIQEKHRCSGRDNWEEVISEFHLVAGKEHKFTQEEYLEKMGAAKYGLCLRGYGRKCHREVELMALGTVPIMTPDVSLSYSEPLIENVHYVLVNGANEVRDKVSSITEDDWEKMSVACYEWYMRNVHSSQMWYIMIKKLIYT